MSSPEHSEGELENREEDMDNGEDGEEHVYQTLDRQERLRVTECVHDLPAEAKVRKHRKSGVSRNFILACFTHKL